MNRRRTIALAAILFQAPLMAQLASGPRELQQVEEPPVPSDPLELVTGDAQPVQDVAQRAEIVNLLINAHRNSNVRAQPYDLKTTFTVSGSSPSAGLWQEEDVSPGAGLYRWTAQGPNYSAVNLTVSRVFYSNQPANNMPLRLAQLRAAIFYTDAIIGPRASIRTAKASLNGIDLTCALIAHGSTASIQTGGRRWEEEEYCVDPKQDVLVTYSPAPGLYVVYDYSEGLKFHGKFIANKFTISEAGQTIIEAKTESVTDPPNNPAAFHPAGLNQFGVGPAMSGPWRMRSMRPSLNGTASGVVVLHGMQSPDGQLAEVEVLASSDPSLNDAALQVGSKWKGGMIGRETEPGVTPQSHEVLMTIQYSAAER